MSLIAPDCNYCNSSEDFPCLSYIMISCTCKQETECQNGLMNTDLSIFLLENTRQLPLRDGPIFHTGFSILSAKGFLRQHPPTPKYYKSTLSKKKTHIGPLLSVAKDGWTLPGKYISIAMKQVL